MFYPFHQPGADLWTLRVQGDGDRSIVQRIGGYRLHSFSDVLDGFGVVLTGTEEQHVRERNDRLWVVVRHTHLMGPVREIQTSDVHPGFDHLLELGDGSGGRT